MSSATPLVLVTGATGYIGAEIAVQFLEKGFNVRQTIRKESQALAWDEKYPQYKGRVTFSLIKALDEPKAFDEAVVGVTYIAHAASPVTFQSEDSCRDVLDPAINGTLSILKSALREPKIKAIVVTSSVVANFDVVNGPPAGTIVSDKTWNPVTYAEAALFPADQGAAIYSASKTLAERAAWSFMETEKPSFTLTTVAPTWVLGPTAEPAVKTQKDLRSTAGMTFHAIVDTDSIPPAIFNPTFVDVRDIARVHVGAVTVPQAAGKRYIMVSDRFNNECAAAAAAKAVPEQAHRFSSIEKAPFGPTYAVDASQAERDFGFTYITLEKSVGDLAKQFFALPLA